MLVRLVCLFSLLCLFCLSSLNTLAQSDPRATAILDKTKETYEKYVAFSAQFSYARLKYQQQKTVEDKISGFIKVKKNKYWIDLGEQEIFNDGKSIYTHLKEDQEVTITELEETEDELSPINIFRIYKENFSAFFSTQKKKGYFVVILKPNNQGADLEKIELYIQEKSFRITSWVIKEKSGIKYRYEVKDFKVYDSLSDEYFRFDQAQNPEVTVIDLR